MSMKSYAIPEHLRDAGDNLLLAATGRLGGFFSTADYKKDGVYYCLAVGDFPNEGELTQEHIKASGIALNDLAQEGLVALHDGTMLKSRAESEETAVEAMGLTRCIVKDTFDPASVEPYTPPPEEPLEEG